MTGLSEIINSQLGENTTVYNGSVVASIKAFRTDSSEAIFITAPLYLEEGNLIFMPFGSYLVQARTFVG